MLQSNYLGLLPPEVYAGGNEIRGVSGRNGGIRTCVQGRQGNLHNKSV